ncbi:hypothetical protein [Flavobacterium sp.]|jgi:hypothetical protein|uniref:hypothetical protein n=1 Tax=Flavobacterium sp. TaxID=239 RepID=UPI0037C16B28
MKTKKYYLLILLITATLSAQNKDCSEIPTPINTNSCNCDCYDLVYDFKCKQFLDGQGNVIKNINDIKVKYKEGFRFKIININKYLYTSTVSYEDILFTSDTPAIFELIFLGKKLNLDEALSNIDKSNFNPITNKEMSELSISKDFDSLKNEETALKEKLETFKNKIDSLTENFLKAYSLCLPDVKCCEEKRDLKKFQTLHKELNELNLEYNILISKITSTSAILEEKLEVLKESLKTTKQKIKIENEINDLNTTISNLFVLRTKIESYGTLIETITEEKIIDLVHFQNNFISQNFEYIYPTIFPTGNQLKLTVDINPNSSDKIKKWLTMPLSAEQFAIDLRVKNRWFYSFSTGPFLSIGSSFRPETYGWQKQPTDNTINEESKYKLVATGREGLPVGIAALANLGTKFSDFYGLGFSVGAGASIADKTNIAYFAGITQFFGQNQQLNLTLGISILQTKELKSALYPDIGNTLYDTPLDLEYSKKFKTGFFVSLTYSVFNSTNIKTTTTKKEEDKKSTDKKDAIVVEDETDEENKINLKKAKKIIIYQD